MLPIILTPGDPQGIGPEVAVSALRDSHLDVVIVGEASVVIQEARRQGLSMIVVDSLETRGGGRLRVLTPPPSSDRVEVSALRFAVRSCLEGRARALVTGPIHKARLAASGFPHRGHTDFLGALCGVSSPVMAFAGGKLRVSLVSVHVALREVHKVITRARVFHVIRVSNQAMQEQLGISQPRIAVCGLNPHAGEGGLLGDEEEREIAPACDLARRQGILVRGPVSAETALRWGLDGTVDWVVAMYHDQGLAPLKVVDFGHSVNWTLGLPIIRTSVDHGTADDIAGKGLADSGSMSAALDFADTISRAR